MIISPVDPTTRSFTRLDESTFVAHLDTANVDLMDDIEVTLRLVITPAIHFTEKVVSVGDMQHGPVDIVVNGTTPSATLGEIRVPRLSKYGFGETEFNDELYEGIGSSIAQWLSDFEEAERIAMTIRNHVEA